LLTIIKRILLEYTNKGFSQDIKTQIVAMVLNGNGNRDTAQVLNVSPRGRAIPMSGPLYRLLAEDHARLDGLLRSSMTEDGLINRAAYAEFRAGLLKHISMEEKILLPTAQRLRGGEPLALAARLRLDHGALAALLVPTPTAAIIVALRRILEAHNVLEEGAGGVYEGCEQLVGTEAEALLAQLRAAPAVPVAPYSDGPQVMDAVRRALVRAGYAEALPDAGHDG
jgi:hypothetical protein